MTRTRLRPCQCPKRATFISTVPGFVLGGSDEVCQCPIRSTFISTNIAIVFDESRETRVNALNGLHSFLQYPFATPVKSRVLGAISVRNCQNILTITVFTQIFWFCPKFPLSCHYTAFQHSFQF